ncbi:hypothetical protein RCG24_14610 [Neobacillus sp. OS1-32]|uniref:hypothetical protein n=1 Tax=Neobacillus sp. OS1-32 TaxID=3070682 RepID=UPI0027E1DE5B|nr:hypothetical protein [Neobacillus sp. OS1-32]WML29216.1 hypothetical protein RCG24_14610 [Neobacillus sp. OS1-32]
MARFLSVKLAPLLLILITGFTIFSSSASAASVQITTFTDTTKESTTTVPKNYHHFYSSKDTVKVTFKVDQWIKTKNIKKVNVILEKDTGLWWSTKATKSVTSTTPLTFSVNAGKGDYRLVVYDEGEPTGYDKAPLYYAKSTKYNVNVIGLD